MSLDLSWTMDREPEPVRQSEETHFRGLPGTGIVHIKTKMLFQGSARHCPLSLGRGMLSLDRRQCPQATPEVRSLGVLPWTSYAYYFTLEGTQGLRVTLQGSDTH